MAEPLALLLVEDDDGEAELVVKELASAGFAPRWARVVTASGLEAALARGGWQVVVANAALPAFAGSEVFDVVSRHAPEVPFVLVCAEDAGGAAAAAVRSGAHDAVERGRLGPAVVRALRDAEERRRRRQALERLEASERTYRHLFETMAQGVVYQDASGRIVAANPAAERVLGLSQEEMRGRTSADSRWQAVREDGSAFPAAEHPAMVALRTGREVSGAVMGVWNQASGSRCWIELHAVPEFRPGEAAPFQVYTTFDDVTQRRERVERIRILNRMLRTTSEINEMIIRERDPHRVVAEACRIAVEHGEFALACAARKEEGDDALRHIFTAGEAVSCPECGGEADGPVPPSCGPLRAALGSATPVIRRPIKAGGGDEAWTTHALAHGFRCCAAFPVRVGERVAGGFAVYSRDETILTEETVRLLEEIASDIGFALETIETGNRRLEAESALAASERRYRRLFERNLAGVLQFEVSGRILEANVAARTMFGLPPEGELGDVTVLRFRDDPGEWLRLREDLRRDGELRNQEVVLRRLDGTTFHALANVTLIRGDDGKAVAIEGTLVDMSESRRMQDQLAEAQKMEAVGRLAGGVAHDFNNLLQAGMGLADLLREDPSAAPIVADELEGLFRRGAALTRQLLLFARRDTCNPQPEDLNDIVKGVAGLLRRLLRENIELQLALGEGPLPCRADRGQLEQVLVNLAVNSSDAMPDGGSLVLSSGTDGRGRVWFAVEDSGEGIPENVREQMFDPFFTTKPAGRGTGLGLSVVHGIVTQHGGTVDVASGTGRGARLRVVLPALAPAEPESVPSPQPPAPLPRGDGERILLVEDQAVARSALRRTLEMLGYAVTEAASAEEAEALPAEEPFALLLTDVVLPHASGLDLAVVLAARWPEIEVVVMSGYSEDEALREDAATGRVNYLQKPFGIDVLARRLRELLAPDPDGSAT